MTNIQQQSQQKADSTEFECGLEGLMHGHLDYFMSFESCSSPRNTEDEDEEGDPLVCRRRRSDLEGDDLAESSAARKRQSRILSRWAARQAQEMITTMERRSRESELMALAGLHTVSMLDSSFLRESRSPTSRRRGEVERLRQQTNIESISNIHLSSTNSSETRGTENRGSLEDVNESENEFGAWSDVQMVTQNENGERDSSSREQSPDGEVDRERVRYIARGFMTSGSRDHSSDVAQRRDSSGEEWFGENERERVRLVREWVQLNSQHRGARGSGRNERVAARGDQDRQGLAVDHDDGQLEMFAEIC